MVSLRKILVPGVSASILESTPGLMELPWCPGDCIPDPAGSGLQGAGNPSMQALPGVPGMSPEIAQHTSSSVVHIAAGRQLHLFLATNPQPALVSLNNAFSEAASLPLFPPWVAP